MKTTAQTLQHELPHKGVLPYYHNLYLHPYIATPKIFNVNTELY